MTQPEGWDDELHPDRMAQMWHEHQERVNGHADTHARAVNRQLFRSMTRPERAVQWQRMQEAIQNAQEGTSDEITGAGGPQPPVQRIKAAEGHLEKDGTDSDKTTATHRDDKENE